MRRLGLSFLFIIFAIGCGSGGRPEEGQSQRATNVAPSVANPSSTSSSVEPTIVGQTGGLFTSDESRIPAVTSRVLYDEFETAEYQTKVDGDGKFGTRLDAMKERGDLVYFDPHRRVNVIDDNDHVIQVSIVGEQEPWWVHRAFVVLDRDWPSGIPPWNLPTIDQFSDGKKQDGHLADNAGKSSRDQIETDSSEETERKAQAKLSLAKNLMATGRDASKFLNGIIEEFPETAAASEAQALRQESETSNP